MDIGTLLILGLLMAVGLVGVVLPVLPGLLLIAGTGFAWAWLEEGSAPWVVFGVMFAVLIIGTIAKYVLPHRTLKEIGAPRSTMLLGVLGAIVGFFLIPVVGLIIGGIAGVYLGEWRRLGNSGAAGRSTWATTKAIGVGMLIELAAGLLAVLIWAVGAVALA